MSNALQNRLVGTVILVAVTVIFLPDYLDGKKQTNTETFVDFPRSTSNLSATAPDTFPNEEVANATRREIEILDEEAADKFLEQTDSAGNDIQTGSKTQNAGVSATNSKTSDKASSSVQSVEEQSKAAVQDNKIKATERSQNSNDQTSTASASSNNEAPNVAAKVSSGNSLAEQTIMKTTPDSATENSGWVVQLGSFGNQKNVNDLLNKLEKAGYRSFSRKVQTSAGRLTKVFVGPELDREKLDLALPHLKQTTGLTGKVTTFDVVSN